MIQRLSYVRAQIILHLVGDCVLYLKTVSTGCRGFWVWMGRHLSFKAVVLRKLIPVNYQVSCLPHKPGKEGVIWKDKDVSVSDRPHPYLGYATRPSPHSIIHTSNHGLSESDRVENMLQVRPSRAKEARGRWSVRCQVWKGRKWVFFC